MNTYSVIVKDENDVEHMIELDGDDLAYKLYQVNNNLFKSVEKLSKKLNIYINNILYQMTIISLNTHENMNIAFNTLKTVYTRILYLKNPREAIKNVVINVCIRDYGSRNLFDVLNDLSKRWKYLPEENRHNLSILIAGRYHRSRFDSLMSKM